MSGAPEEIDVVIVGAGISGIAMAHQISEDHPGLSYAVLESRQRVGGTWDLFRYPGIRSDSGMNTFAYSFRPWPGANHFGSGEEIRSYIEETAAAYGIDRHIRFGSRVAAADWSSESSRWTVTVERDAGNGQPETSQIQCRFLIGCTGYYRYDRGYEPAFAGEEEFRGEMFHAQHWPDDLELNDRDVVVVGPAEPRSHRRARPARQAPGDHLQRSLQLRGHGAERRARWPIGSRALPAGCFAGSGSGRDRAVHRARESRTSSEVRIRGARDRAGGFRQAMSPEPGLRPCPVYRGTTLEAVSGASGFRVETGNIETIGRGRPDPIPQEARRPPANE